MIDVLLGLGVLGLLVAIWFAALFDAARFSMAAWAAAGRSKERTLVLLFLTGGIGGIYWFTRIRSDIADTAHSVWTKAGSRT